MLRVMMSRHRTTVIDSLSAGQNSTKLSVLHASAGRTSINSGGGLHEKVFATAQRPDSLAQNHLWTSFMENFRHASM